jgi:hypothetical protein
LKKKKVYFGIENGKYFNGIGMCSSGIRLLLPFFSIQSTHIHPRDRASRFLRESYGTADGQADENKKRFEMKC